MRLQPAITKSTPTPTPTPTPTTTPTPTPTPTHMPTSEMGNRNLLLISADLFSVSPYYTCLRLQSAIQTPTPQPTPILIPISTPISTYAMRNRN